MTERLRMEARVGRYCIVLPPTLMELGAEHASRAEVLCAEHTVMSRIGRPGELLRALEVGGHAHALFIGEESDAWLDDVREMINAIESKPSQCQIFVREGRKAAWNTRWGVRIATGLRLRDPHAVHRFYPLRQLSDLQLPACESGFEMEALIPISCAGIEVGDVLLRPSLATNSGGSRPSFAFDRFHRFCMATMYRWFLPPAYLKLASQREFQALPFRERLRESVNELLLREPGSSARVGASAGFGFFMGLIPLWGYQIILTVLLSHRLGFSKTIALLCAQISLPPLIPFIMYGSLVLGRMLLGVEAGTELTSLELAPDDFSPWFLGSWVLAISVGLFGGAIVWLLVIFMRRMRGSRKVA